MEGRVRHFHLYQPLRVYEKLEAWLWRAWSRGCLENRNTLTFNLWPSL